MKRVNEFLKYNENNKEPKKVLDQRLYNSNGVLSFYYQNLSIPNQDLLDIGNYYFKMIGRDEYTIKREDYNATDGREYLKKNNILKVCSVSNLGNIFKKSELFDILEFLSQRCKEEEELGNYAYIRKVCVFIVTQLLNNAVQTDKLYKQYEKEFYEFEKKCNLLYASNTYDLLKERLKSILNEFQKDGDFNLQLEKINEIIKDYKEISERKTSRKITYNNEKYALIEAEEIYQSDWSYELIELGSIFAEYADAYIKIMEDKINFLENIFANINLEKNKYKVYPCIKKVVKDEKIEELDFVGIGLNRVSVWLNSSKEALNIGYYDWLNKIKLGNSIRSVNIKGFEKKNNENLYISNDQYNGISMFSFYIKKEIYDKLNIEEKAIVEDMLIEKIKEVYARKNNLYHEENDKIFVNKTLDMINLFCKLRKDSRNTTRLKI